MKKRALTSSSVEKTIEIGRQIGLRCRGGEIFELVSDLGGGKTAFVRGLARGIGSEDEVTSPSFTINNSYKGKTLRLEHFDFYRLDDPGVIRQELQEDLEHDGVVVAVEWADVVVDSMPNNRVTITLIPVGEDKREVNISYPDNLDYLFFEGLE